MFQVHLYKVEMTCEGCANSISNVLNKNKGELKLKKSMNKCRMDGQGCNLLSFTDLKNQHYYKGQAYSINKQAVSCKLAEPVM